MLTFRRATTVFAGVVFGVFASGCAEDEDGSGGDSASSGATGDTTAAGPGTGATTGASGTSSSGTTSSCGTSSGGFNPGSPDFYDDYSGDSIARDDAAETKRAWATARGYSALVDANEDTEQAGWIYTVEPSDIPGHECTFPFPSQRGLMLEGHPQLGSIPDMRQTDYYVELDNLPPSHAVQFWLYVVDAGSMPSTFGAGNKFFYYAEDFPGGFFLVNSGFMSFEHQDPSYSQEQRVAFESGNVPHNELYWDVAAHGPTGTPGEVGRMSNTGCVEGTFPDLFQNVSKKHVLPNRWVLHKLVLDMTQPDGVLRLYIRERGEPEFTLVMESPAAGVSWPTDASLPPQMARLRIPTVENAYPLDSGPGTGSGQNWKVVGDFAWAVDEADLPTYAE